MRRSVRGECSGIESVHQLHGSIFAFLGEQVCVAAAVCKSWRKEVQALPEQYWKVTALRLWPGIADMDVLTYYASYRELVMDKNRLKHWTSEDVIVPFAMQILEVPGFAADSRAFICAGLEWCLRLYWCEEKDTVSIFLCLLGEEGGDDSLDEEYTLPVRAEITLKNRYSSNANRSRILCQTFTTQSSSWGWRSFIPADLFRNSKLGYVANNEVIVKVKLQWWLADALRKFKLGHFKDLDLPADAGTTSSLLALSTQLRGCPSYNWDAKEMYYSLMHHHLALDGWEVLCTGDLARLTKEEHAFIAKLLRRIRVTSDLDQATIRSRLIRCLAANDFSFKRTLKYLKVKRNFGVYCDGCGAHNFPGERLNCRQCRNYDLCATCYRAEVETCQHKKVHSMSVLEPNVWLDV